jgi:uncharacterized membrane protein YdjX (TVP38/TMEM64 family)
MKRIIRVLLVLAVVLAWFVFYKLELGSYLTFANIKNQQAVFLSYAQDKFFLAIIFFSLTYILVTALSLPGATILTLAGGMIFGAFTGTLITVISATFGATLAFLSARFLFGNWVLKKYEKQLGAFNKGITENGFSYLLFLRLVPMFPFFLINLAMGVTKIRTRDFFLASIIGMLPGSFVYCNAGTQLASINSLNDLVSTRVLVSFFLLGCLALVPLVYKKVRSRKA